MSVVKHGKYYRMIFMFNGRRFQKSTRCTSRRAAEEVERAFRTQLAKGDYGFEEKLPIPGFKDAMREYLDWRNSEHNYAKNSCLRTKTASKALLKFFNDVELDKITIEGVENFKQWRKVQIKQPPHKSLKRKTNRSNKAIKPGTVNRELACLRAMLNYFIKKEIIARNPVSSVKFLKEENEQLRVVSNDEERRYLMACSQPLQDVATVMIDTGMRPSEVCKLKREHVDLVKGTVFIDRGKTRAARRRIPLTSRALKILERRLRKVDGEFLFPAMRRGSNSHIVKLNKAHNAAIGRAELNSFRLYDLRHTFATRAAEAGVDLVTIAALLGHSRIQMLMRYAHPTEQHQVDAIRKIETIRQRGSVAA